MNILHGYPVYRADAGAVSPDPESSRDSLALLEK
jgi:hypothetical protein